MKNVKTYLLGGILCVGFSGYSQSGYTPLRCDVELTQEERMTSPLYGNPEFLERVAEIRAAALKNKSRLLNPDVSYSNGVDFAVPVQVNIFTDDNGTNQAIDEDDVVKYMEEMNEYYRTFGIEFYLECAINIIPSTTDNTISGTSERNSFFATYDNPGHLTMNFVFSMLDNNGVALDGRAKRPRPNVNNHYNLIIARQTSSNAARNYYLLFVHEVAHTLGLSHPHAEDNESGVDDNADASACFQEYVDESYILPSTCVKNAGSKACTVNGDMICDTPASPGRIGSNLTIVPDPVTGVPTCTYTGPWAHGPDTDHNGDSWDPDEYNHMQHGNGPCRRSFTPGQINRMITEVTMLASSFNSASINVNRDSWGLEGTQHASDDETFYAPRYMIAPTTTIPGATSVCQPGSKTVIEAGARITLNPGFRAEVGSYFEARIDTFSCDKLSYPGSSSSSSSSSSMAIVQENPPTDWMIEIADLYQEAVERNQHNYKSFVSGKISHQVYPNPTKNEATLEFFMPHMESVSIQIMDQYGRNVKWIRQNQLFSEGKQRINMEISDLKTGIYFYQLSTDGNNYSGKLIKQ